MDARQYAFYLSEQNINQLDAIRGIKSRSQCVRELIEDAFQYWDYQRAEEYYGNLPDTNHMTEAQRREINETK